MTDPIYQQKVSTQVSLCIPLRLTWVETICCLSIVCLLKAQSTKGIRLLLDKMDIYGSINNGLRCSMDHGGPLTPFPNKPLVLRLLQYKSFKDIVGKGKT